MAHYATEQSQPSEAADEMELLVVQCDAAIRKYTEVIASLEESLNAARDRYARLVEARDEAQTVAVNARSVLHRASALFKTEPGFDAASARLRVVPDEPSSGTPPSAGEADEPSTPEHGADSSAPAAEEPPVEVLVRGARMKEILTAIGARPDLSWGTADVAAVLGVTEENAAGRRALRENLRNLAMRGALERVAVEGDFHTYYRPRMNWRFV
ncbi:MULTISPECIES: hypothetical protein [unclassified Streptomyces]|uniref:hypothetical protein n=1 Tax=unclassified Streptomyces TaxID=2593676 RepID=UPI001BE803BB|nr:MULTISPECIES: hypothetical protein [unclassified Streptomyces]MBT2446354.1 hypothetical protein [Streptomyces sp. ISL-43]MBT2478758.1 hypothetical protein [Streptomyces sp. ISL-94]